jgi:small-conductance mechanosensitive channel
MSYQTWHDYGYGIKTDNLITDEENIRNLIKMSPYVKAEITAHLENYNLFDDMDKTDLLNNIEELNYNRGQPDMLAGLLTQIISTLENIPIIYVTDFDDSNYVIVTATYPWKITDEMQKWQSKDDIEKIFEKYINVLTDQSLTDLEWGYHEIENGG